MRAANDVTKRDIELAVSAVSKTYDAEIAKRDAELARLRAELDAAPTATLRQQLAGSQSALSKVMGELTEPRDDVRRLEAALDAANRELAQARAERDEAVSKIREYAEHVNFYGNLLAHTEMARRKLDEQVEFYRGELSKAQVCADSLAALAWKWKYKADCQRETTMALVVAARAMDFVGFVKMGQVRWYAAVRGAIKQAKQSGQQAGEVG